MLDWRLFKAVSSSHWGMLSNVQVQELYFVLRCCHISLQAALLLAATENDANLKMLYWKVMTCRPLFRVRICKQVDFGSSSIHDQIELNCDLGCIIAILAGQPWFSGPMTHCSIDKTVDMAAVALAAGGNGNHSSQYVELLLSLRPWSKHGI